MLLSGADIVIKTLLEQGCNVVFGYPGGQILSVYDSLYKYKNEIRHILSAHEQGAAHAADGYARATGKVGVVLATSGPGATNLVTGIATAHLDSVPMVAITGNVATSQIGYDSFQEIDITGITLPITKHNYFVENVEDLADTIREAFSLAMSGRPGPVLVDIPKDVQMAMCEYTPAPAVTMDEKLPAKDKRIAAAAKCINESEKPYIYFGGGLVSSNATKELIELADKIDAPIGCSMMGLSAIPTDHPRFLGMQGMHGKFASSAAMNSADCIISLGTRFNDRVIGERENFKLKAKIVHIDIDASELSKTITSHHNLRGDIKKTLEKLIPELTEKTHPKWQKEINTLCKKGLKFEDKREGMTPKNILEMLNNYIKPDMPIATDVGQHQMWAAQILNLSKSRKFISSGGLGTMGFGLGAAIGAHMGTGEKTVLITGDGSFGMNLNELVVAVENNVPLVILIMNNGVLGMVRQMQTMYFEKHYSETVLGRPTDFVKVAQAFGAKGEKASTIDELKTAFDNAFSYNGPYVIDCKIDKDEFVLPVMEKGGCTEEIIVESGEYLK